MLPRFSKVVNDAFALQNAAPEVAALPPASLLLWRFVRIPSNSSDLVISRRREKNEARIMP